MNKLELRFNEYQRLAESYARKIFNYDSIAYEQDDIIQEFRIKLYEVILAYERAKKERRESGRIAPTPFPIYLRGALSNFSKDFIKRINDEMKHTVGNQLGNSYDYGKDSPNTSDLNITESIFVINGFDLTKNLSGLSRAAFIMFLKGNRISDIQKKLGNSIDVAKVVNRQRSFLRKNRSEFELEQENEFLVTEFSETV